MFDTIISIDPGVGGGIIVKRNETIKAIKMPSFKDLSDFLSYYKDISDNPIVFIEKVQLMHSDLGGGIAFRMQTMLSNYSELLTVIKMIGFPFIEVYPMTWQSTLGLRRKFESIENYKRLEFYKEKKSTKRIKDEIKKIKSKEKTLRKNRYKEIAIKEFPMIKVTLHTSDALLILKFGLFKIMNAPKYIHDNIKNYNSQLPLNFKL